MREQDIRFRSGQLELAGTIAWPDGPGPFQAVLLITGSGQIDRDENAPKFRLNAFFDIAHYLAENGFASLRYDKRGVGQSAGDYWSTGFFDNVQDARAALDYLRQQPSIQPEHVFLLGHSEGAFIATRMSGNAVPVAGTILISGAAQSGEAVLKWQALQIAKGLKGLSGWIIRTFHIDVSKSQQKSMDKIKRTTKNWYRQQLLVKINAKWLREFMAYDPAGDMPRISVPVLAITGSKDIQVDPADLERMAQLVKTPFESHLIPNMTHMLRVETGEATLANYRAEIKRPVAPELLEIILDWLKKMGSI